MRTKEYWENRYATGGNSGAGSRGRLALYKVNYLNQFIRRMSIDTVGDFGCGDNYISGGIAGVWYDGYDIAENIGAIPIAEYNGYRKYDLTISLDVIFHLLEEMTFEDYMCKLFDASSKFVIIYSSNGDCEVELAEHMADRHFTGWVEAYRKDFKLIHTELNKYPFDINNVNETSISNWYIYELIS